VLTRRNDGGGEGRGHGRHVEMGLEVEVVASCRVVPLHEVNLIYRNC
jgi:hypothetical protein